METVLNTSTQINGKPYDVQIQTNRRTLKIDVREENADEFQALELPYTEAFEMMNSKDDYESLLDLLTVEDGQFLLNTSL
jgi:hypothetical protein